MSKLVGGPTSGEWRAWSSDAHATARRVVRDLETADDLAQEALVLLMRCHADVRDPHSWFFVVLRRLAMRHARLMRECALEVELVARRESLDSRLDMERALSSLPSRQARLLALTFEGYSHAEIAQRIACAVHQVGPRLARAYRALARRLGVGLGAAKR